MHMRRMHLQMISLLVASLAELEAHGRGRHTQGT